MSKKKSHRSAQQAEKRTAKELYEAELKRLQVELVVMQQWVLSAGARVLVIFEGRDAAGKGGAIKRIMQYLNPRYAHIVALTQASAREKGQWYFQRYIERLPDAGEIVLMDRSWYNRAGVERVMGYCTDEQYERFLRQVPVVERMLVDDGITVIKYWFSVSDEVQQTRFASRLKDPRRRGGPSKATTSGHPASTRSATCSVRFRITARSLRRLRFPTGPPRTITSALRGSCTSKCPTSPQGSQSRSADTASVR